MGRRSSAPYRSVVLALALGLGACSASVSHPSVDSLPTATPDAVPSALVTPSSATRAPGPTPAATAIATIPPDLPRATSIEQNGIRVSLDLERNPLPAGEETWATLRVTNIGPDDVLWTHDGCAIPASVWGEMSTTWRPGPLGDGVTERYQFRESALRLAGDDTRTIRVGFTPESFLGVGSFGCADIAIQDELEPGASLERRAQWDGMAFRALGLPPDGELTLTVWAGYYERASEVDPDAPSTRPITLTVPAWIVGGRDARVLHPAEIVDAALMDEAFGRWLDARDVNNGNEPRLWFDPAANAWHVELLTYTHVSDPPGTVHGLLLDPETGEVLDVLDYPWDGSFDHHGW